MGTKDNLINLGLLAAGGVAVAAAAGVYRKGSRARFSPPVSGPSVKRIEEGLQISRQQAQAIKDAMNDGKPNKALRLASEATGNFGVEYIESDQDTMRSREGIEYVNTGDTYNTTLIYDYKTGRFYIGSWGGWVERYPRRFGY